MCAVEDDIPDASSETNGDSESNAASIGSRVHEILRAVDFGERFDEQVVMVASTCESGIKDKVVEACKRLKKSDLYAEMCEAEVNLKEAPFRLKVGSSWITGRIDLIYRLIGRWTVVDYKTGESEMKDRYELQVGIYAGAVKALLGEMPERVALIPLGRGKLYQQTPTTGDIEKVQNKVTLTIARIAAGDFPSKVSKRCEWCGYSARLCKGEIREEQLTLNLFTISSPKYTP
jgi:hypothetical protein